MDVSWPLEQFLLHSIGSQDLPDRLSTTLQHGSNAEYLDTLSLLALDPKFTGAIFITQEPIFVEISSRWLLQADSQRSSIAALAAYARLLPVAPYLAEHAAALLNRRQESHFMALCSKSTSALLDLPAEDLQVLLLAMCRLLLHDQQTYASYISPAHLTSLVNHPEPCIRCLAIRVFCIFMYASDMVMETMLKQYLGESETAGPWEDRLIDYKFLSLWERERLRRLNQDAQDFQHLAEANTGTAVSSSVNRILYQGDFSSTTAAISEVLLPKGEAAVGPKKSIVMTRTITSNLKMLARGIKGGEPILISGPPCSGKTLLINEVAQAVGKGSSLVVLNLNEQVDAKALVGMYAYSASDATITWRPGVLTKAVKDGDWILLENIDRASIELITILMPLVERGELLIPGRDSPVRVGPGFKLIATTQNSVKVGRSDVSPDTRVFGIRHWAQVRFDEPSQPELAEIVSSLFPPLTALIPRMMQTYKNVATQSSQLHDSRPTRQSDFLRWAKRIDRSMRHNDITESIQPLPHLVFDHMFLDAIDSFCGHLPLGSLRNSIEGIVGQQLQMPAERIEYNLRIRRPSHRQSASTLHIGRVELQVYQSKFKKISQTHIGNAKFAMTSHFLRILESVAAVVQNAEPCLLVGETGTGKTTIVQQLAKSLGHDLLIINLSQQSEASDLLGGFKPTNPRTIASPLHDEFVELLQATFPNRQNGKFLGTLAKAIAKARWMKVVELWQEALRSVQPVLKARKGLSQHTLEPHRKKRRVQTISESVGQRWERFASDINTFHTYLSRGMKNFAFSFIEGSLVEAVRQGQWVLLDEINLASAETLEVLADLIWTPSGQQPSLLLTDTGEKERIHAHNDFRIFGAMNPATDVGKRDLPLSVRSQFTELYINESDQNLSDLSDISETYLGANSQWDKRLATVVAQLYLELKKMALASRLVDGSNNKPHFSLRTLARALTYACDTASSYGLRRAVFEGFMMCFSTSLNTESRSIVRSRIESQVLGPEKIRKAILKQLPSLPDDGQSYVRFQQYWVAQGALQPVARPLYIITPFVEQNLLNIVRAASTRRYPVLLQGPTSSGKTSMIEYLAFISGNKHIRINNHEHTDLQEYLGMYVSGVDGKIEYQDGVLVKALREGHWIVLDELNLAPSDVLESLNRLLDDNRELLIPETQEIIRPHKHFMLFATQNPAGIYGGRKALSRAFRNRFLEIHFEDIPEDELGTILRERTQIAPSFCAKIIEVYKQLTVLRQRDRLFEQKQSFATLRDLFRWAMREADDRTQLAINGFLLLSERVRNERDRMAVKEVIETVLKTSLDIDVLYGWKSSYIAQETLSASSQGVIWTKSMRRVYVLVNEALKNNEPVLLVGETGSGKTTVCQAIPEIMGKKLHTINAHQNLETGDIIGAQRPFRLRASAERELSQALCKMFEDHGYHSKSVIKETAVLLQEYDDLINGAPDLFSQDEKHYIRYCRARSKTLFEWSDGSLVTAMSSGSHFLLDEISLADDSVLERLNSVLEPGRTLYLAEKGTNDASIEASAGFQFMATMNPGGDYGKRELSPALRNRFTEIWVPTASNTEELTEIVAAKLQPECRDLASNMVTFATWFAEVNGSSHGVSIRDLIAWTAFVNHFDHLPSSFPVYHGAEMIYLDRLGTNSSVKLVGIESTFSHIYETCLSKLEELFMIPRRQFESCLDLIDKDDSFHIGDFSLNKMLPGRSKPTYSLSAPTTLKNAHRVIRAYQLNKPILLEGLPGVGKTTLIEALAAAIGMPLTRINLSDQTDLVDLLGSDIPIATAEAGLFGWREAPFLKAMQRGEWVLLDEMNLASQSVLEGLNACLDHRGEVYVSELDQTFARHSRFRLFASQNPHAQGGGRKGLPVSFTDRFTVVYTDILGREDLTQICTNSFPNVDPSLVEKMTQYVSDAGLLISKGSNQFIQGGPWEVNLRDAARWLQVLEHQFDRMGESRPEDYQDMLFHHRFRTPEDRNAMVMLQTKHFREAGPSLPRFVAKTAEVVKIGQGIMRRDQTNRHLRNRTWHIQTINVSIAESLLLCIKRSWPTILVGPSRSGKTELILHLADLMGAEVVEMCLNPDMDTMDLVGGFEQVDEHRRFDDLLMAVKKFTREQLIEHGLCCHPDVHSWAEAVASLQECSDPQTLTLCLQNLSALELSTRYEDFSSICGQISRNLAADNRARFEWVDGLLVRALRQGKWIVLDNANLCNPSVLDRLNALLEPRGCLSIHEHCDEHGNAENVKPHPNFRLFMTMDPRHGELSRAMRNRSVELFMQSGGNAPSITFHPLDPTIDASESGFAPFQKFDWVTKDVTSVIRLLSVCFNRLPLGKIDRLREWESQFTGGLCRMTIEIENVFRDFVDAYGRSDRVVVKELRQAYSTLFLPGKSSVNLGSLQPMHPYNNSILMRPSCRQPETSGLAHLGRKFELLSDIIVYNQKVATICRTAQSKLPEHLTRLEKLFASSQYRESQKDPGSPMGQFLKDLGQWLQSIVDSGDFEQSHEEFYAFAYEILLYLEDVLAITHSSSFGDAVLPILFTTGQSLVARTSRLALSKELATRITDELAAIFQSFNFLWQLCSGWGMQQLWQSFRLSPYRTKPQFEASIKISKLAERLDDVRFRLDIPMTELLRQQKLLLDIKIASGRFEISSPADFAIDPTIEKLCDQPSSNSFTQRPHFEECFDHILQYSNLSKHQNDPLWIEVALLAGQPTKTLMKDSISSDSWKQISGLQGSLSSQCESNDIGLIRQTLSASILKKILGVDKIPMGCLHRLKAESLILFKAVLSLGDMTLVDPIGHIESSLQRLRNSVSIACKPLSWDEDKQAMMQKVDLLPRRLNGLPIDFDTLYDPSPQEINQTRYVKEAIAYALGPSDVSDNLVDIAGWSPYRRLGDELLKFFTACLLLYIPDRNYDPALKALMEQECYSNRYRQLSDKLAALQTYEYAVSGQSSSHYINIVQYALENLGAIPQAIPVYRPQEANAGALTKEFNAILRGIVLSIPALDGVQAPGAMNAKSVRQLESLRRSLRGTTAKLSRDFPAFEDVVKPMIAMLKCLDAGLALYQIHTSETSTSHSIIGHIGQSTPFMGSSRNEVSPVSSDHSNGVRNQSFDSASHFLDSVIVVAAVEGYIPPTTIDPVLQAFHGAYQEWKEQLDKDQLQHAVTSSIYRYKSGADEDQEAEDDEVSRLFPRYEEAEDTVRETANLAFDPRQKAVGFARLQRSLLGQAVGPSNQILTLLQRASGHVAQLWNDNSNLSIFPIPVIDMLPAIVMELSSHHENIWDPENNHKLYDFYADANHAEVQKLVPLIQEILARYSDLQTIWPEHATLTDVLRSSKELLAMPHTDPLAKLLTKVEKIHSFLHEWQVVASREHSTVSLFDRLSQTIITWRQKELSSWSTLLDKEDEQCRVTADSWWFIAYETIIAAPLSAAASEDQDQEIYAQSLLVTLADFLSSTSLGQFCQRMKILSAFERHGELAARQYISLQGIANALRNFVGYYMRFIPLIENILSTGRQKMEKDLKEVLLLASWKDTTIGALRDSAKRSHHRLFKIVRKYRALLAQTVEGILAQGLSDAPMAPETHSSLREEQPIISPDKDATKICQNYVPDWATKPARFRNPEVTVQTMHRLSLSSAGGLSLSLNLNDFVDALVTNIDSLQKATPNTMNDENAPDASYVKSRKRKLYSDTMRELRQMGFRSNLSADVLRQQDSISTILAGTPSLKGLVFSAAPMETESHFHQLVNLIPQVREIMHKHSEDLSHELVAQSQGMFDSILKELLGQRRVIAETASNLSRIRSFSEVIEVTVTPKDNGQLQLSNQKESHANIKRTLQWLSAVLRAALTVVEKCGKLSGTSNDYVQEVLEGHRSKLDASITKLHGLPKMPTGLNTASELTLSQEAVEQVTSVRDSLSLLTEKSPHLTFVFRQVELWTCWDPVDCERQTDERQPIGISQYDADVAHALDSMLVAVQDMAAQLAVLPTSDSDPKWLVKADHANAQALKSLHTDSIAPLIEAIASLMCQVQNPQGEGLTVASALCSMAHPIIQQYDSICSSLLSHYVRSYRSLARLAIILARTFVRIGKDGFCNPSEQSKNESRQNQKLEEGTGLGSGEGAQDISNEIQDDEDLSELAQESKAEKGEDSMDKQDDAVNMDHDELEGGMSNGSEDDNASVDESQDDEGNELDEEQGDVDDLDPTAVDEKLWDGKGGEDQKEKEGESSKSQPNEAEKSAAGAGEMNKDEHQEIVQEGYASDHEGAEESEAVAREQAEALDPHTEEGQNLELPEGMDLDNQESPVSEVDSQDDVDFEDRLDEGSLEKMIDADEDDHESLSEMISQGGTPEGVDEDGQETQEGEESLPSANVPDGIGNQDATNDVSLEESANAAATAKSSLGKETLGLAQDNNPKSQDAEVDGIDGTGQDNDHHPANDQSVREELSGHGEQSARTDRTQARGEKTESTAEDLPRQTFHQLGDALEQWYRQQKKILEATEQDTDNANEVADVDMKDQEVEDLPDDVEGGRQVLGAATQEQVRGLDDRAFRSEVEAQDSQYSPTDEIEEESKAEDHEMEEGFDMQFSSNDFAADSVRSKPFISAREEPKAMIDKDQPTRDDEDDIDDLDQDLSITSIQPSILPSVRSDHEARQTWLQYENATRDLSFYLTEQLRLILSPTQATKLRGDFRTGKRLNMKRIIPYIASDFKKDKIWMRRSAPSKRTYQIMLAVDDSKSMRQSESPHLAFGALALIAKSLSMLEVGEVCVVGFGNDVVVAHDFDTPLSSEAGGAILKTFGFQQAKTDVAKLITETISLFRDARRRGSHSSADLWQLELIISDGLCEDHEKIRRLVRQAQEERIMMVFIIVDALNPGESIVDMNQAAFEADASGESRLKIKRYLDGFPFPYYLIVGDVKELPAVLAQALRQWFAEVADAN